MNQTLLAILLATIGTVLGSIGSLFFKKAATKLHSFKKALSKEFLTPFIIGASSFVLSVLIYTFALSLVELSFLFPFVSLSYIWTNILSITVLKEKVSRLSWEGVLLVVLGVIILTIP